MMIHSLALKGDAKQSMGTQQPLVMFKDLSTGQWEGPVKVQLIGRGYMCVCLQIMVCGGFHLAGYGLGKEIKLVILGLVMVLTAINAYPANM